MSTITTKQLRENMSQVIRDLGKGKSVQLSYRHKIIGILQPIDAPAQAQQRGSSGAIQKGLESLKTALLPHHISQDNRSIKEQIAEMRIGKYW